ncbi:MAG: biotin synthase BioB [Candidatus Desulforudis sp.]|nr:biotin synthase BioB [Desulforudis sp.]
MDSKERPDYFWEALADKALRGEILTREEADAVLQAPDTELLPILQAAFRVRRHFFGVKVRLNMLINAKSGLCSENCGYCAQSAVSKAKIDKYGLVDKKIILQGAEKADQLQAETYCIVGSGRAPSNRELEQVIEAVREIKERYPMRICLSLGLLNEEQAARLKAAGVDRYNHNLNTSANHAPNLVTTHTYQDRVGTVKSATRAGLMGCSGCIVGTGETDADIYDLACELRALDVESIPVNFLHPIPGTPLGDRREFNPGRCLKILAFFRFMCPAKEIRISGGREVNLRSLQPLGLYAANSIFIGGYLTTSGRTPEADYEMISDLGFEIDRGEERAEQRNEAPGELPVQVPGAGVAGGG